MALAGCSNSGSKTPNTPAPEPKPKEPIVKTPVKTGAIEIVARDPKGAITWVVKAQESTSKMAASGLETGELLTVAGEVYQGGQVAGTFTCKTATANPTTRQLNLTGSVEMKSVTQKVTLTADKVEWMESRQLIAATGNVFYRSDVWTLGPSPVQWATPNLDTIGTPDQF